MRELALHRELDGRQFPVHAPEAELVAASHGSLTVLPERRVTFAQRRFAANRS
jgi:hypothetical protein